MTTPQIVPPDPRPNFDKVGAAVATGLSTAWPILSRLGRWSYGDFVAKGYLSYVGSSARVLTAAAILALIAYHYFQGGTVPDDAMLQAAIAAYLGGTGLTDAGNRRNADTAKPSN